MWKDGCWSYECIQEERDVTAIWTNDGDKWRLTHPDGFPDEATLHRLIAETPSMLPLAGAPDLVILGEEVQLGAGFADLVGVEDSGRPVVIEVKLSSNAEARRAVVAQIMAYAAYLHGMTIGQLEEGPLRKGLKARGHSTILDSALAVDQEGAIDADDFRTALAAHLSRGRFRLVLVLDRAPEELITLVAYLEHVASELQIDLVTVSAFDVGGTQVVLPQRVTPERHAAVVDQEDRPRPSKGSVYEGDAEFESSLTDAPADHRATFERLLEWVRGLTAAGHVRLRTYRGKGGRVTLMPYFMDENVGLVTIWNDRGTPYLSLWRSVFERRAPDWIEKVEELVKPDRLGQGTTTSAMGEDVLKALSEAYQTGAERVEP